MSLDTVPQDLSPAELLQEAILRLRNGELQLAEEMLAAVLHACPGQSDALHFLGVLRHNQGRGDEAIELIRQSLQAMPENPGAWTNLGNVLLNGGAVDEAVQAYERAIQTCGGDERAASAMSNLGTIHIRQHRLDLAEAACRQAVGVLPELAEGWYNLSLVLMRQGRINESLLAHSRAVVLWPRHLQGRNNVLLALLHLGEKERAAELYREWLAQDPDHPVVLHQLKACLGEDTPARASDAYVQTVFDTYADSFDAKLEELDYRAPQLVEQALREAAGPPQARLDIVDAGCGTGLCGPLLRPWARHLAGCDLSVGMLRRAHPRRVYDVLHQAELVYYLDTQPGRFDAVVSADTLCYFGQLEALFAAARKCLRPGGWFVFTVEALPDDAPFAHRLQHSGRYAHRLDYVRDTLVAAGLQVHAHVAQKLRSEAGLPVPGWVVTAVRP